MEDGATFEGMGAPGGFTKKEALVRTKRTWVFVASAVLVVVGYEPMMVAIINALNGHLHWLWGLLAVVAFYGAVFGPHGTDGGENSAAIFAPTKLGSGAVTSESSSDRPFGMATSCVAVTACS